MNNAYKLCLVNDQIKTVGVVFEPFGRVYTYLTTLTLKEGQEVIVETSNDDRLQVVTVARVDAEAIILARSTVEYRWVLSDKGTEARKEQERLRMLEKQTLGLLNAAEKKAIKAETWQQLEEQFGDALKEIKAIDFTKDPLGGE